MQAALCILPSSLPLKTLSPKSTAFLPKSSALISYRARSLEIKAASEISTVDYSSMISVFPAEACETIGGDACLADIYPEVRLNPEAKVNAALNNSIELVDREYLDYNGPKTVFPAEACDDLGGEFCGRPYQRGVY